MSFDPFASGSDVPPEYNPAAPPTGDGAAIRQRVQAPAIALIVIGIINELAIGWILVNVVMMTTTPADRLHEQMLDMYQSFPEMKAELSKKSPDELKTQIMVMGWGWVALGLLSSTLTLIGGIRMLSLKNYALGICGAICAALPCLSGLACCGVGEIVGIWALVVLINPDVRAAFH